MWCLSICIILSSISCLNCSSTSNLTETLKDTFDNIVSLVEKVATTQNQDATSYLDSSELVKSLGYEYEAHNVTTTDGYILQMFRIPQTTGPLVLVLHGLFSSSDDYLALGKNSLAIRLAAQGYDVWLGNTRGNTYSMGHKTLSPDDAAYWDFSWHEMGIYDVRAMIDYCLENRNVSKLTYIGHSQGTTVAYVLLSMVPEYNTKLNGVISLAPIAWMSNLTSPLVQALADVRLEIDIAFKALGIHSLFHHKPPISTVTLLCGSNRLLSSICSTFLFPAFGFSYSGIDYEFSRTQYSHYPAGSSLKQVLHYLQNIKSRLFQMYDYGLVENLLRYGSGEAPSYPVNKITAPMALFHSDNDWLSNFPKDVEQLIEKLPNGAETYKVPRESFNHMDYQWGVDAGKIVYPKVIEFIQKYINVTNTSISTNTTSTNT